jgi:hypothetical protein
MTKKDFLFPTLFAGASIIFVVASLAVYFSGGRSKKWISRKMKIGAFMLSLPAVSACNTEPQMKCYDTVAINSFRFYNTQNGIVAVNPDSTNIIGGRIRERYSDNFSFQIADSSGKIFQKDNIFAKDKVFDSTTENFELSVDKNIPDGKYILHLFAAQKEKQDSSRYEVNSIGLKIKHLKK